MLGRWLLAVSLLIAASSVAPAQSPPAAAAPSSQASQSRTALVPISNAPRRSLASVSSGAATLPHEDGQVWREYDLTHYTKSVTSTRRPEQAIVDWILRETGYEAWHTQPFGILSASADALYVYHTPEMHATVAEIVDRFVRSAAEPHAFGLRVVSMGNPNWRSRSLSMMRALPVQTQGVQAWLMQREDVALLLAEMAKRTDYREHGSPHMIVENGQSAVVSQRRPRTYIREVIPRADVWPAFQQEAAQFDEGFALEFSPLVGLDGHTIDAVIKCHIDQVEKLVPVMLDVPSPVAPRQRTKIEVPQVTHYSLHERFRWPADQVLVVGMGMVALPEPENANPLVAALPLVSGPTRGDLLVIVESRGAATAGPAGAAVGPTAFEDVVRDRY